MSESPKPEGGRKCTTCKKPDKGHKGPVGRLCENKDTEHISVTDENLQECMGMDNKKSKWYFLS